MHFDEILGKFWLFKNNFGPMGSNFKTTTVMTLSFRTDRSGQTVQTQIRLLLEEQSDQGLHCLLFPLHRIDKITKGLWPLCMNFC